MQVALWFLHEILFGVLILEEVGEEYGQLRNSSTHVLQPDGCLVGSSLYVEIKSLFPFLPLLSLDFEALNRIRGRRFNEQSVQLFDQSPSELLKDEGLFLIKLLLPDSL